MTESAKFIWLTCQIGAETPLKEELSRLRPEYRLAYSRPGFVSFKVPEDFRLSPGFELGSVFARQFAVSLGKVPGDSFDARLAYCKQVAAQIKAVRVNAWEKDFLDRDGESSIQQSELPKQISGGIPLGPERLRPNDVILDVALVDEKEWWLGFHLHTPAHRFFPESHAGSLLLMELPKDAPSRAYLKIEEAIALGALPLKKGERALEFGSAPGGAVYALLERGLTVVGVDPGEMAGSVARNPNFKQIRRQAAQLTSKDLREVHWVFSDMNVNPEETLAVVEKLMTTPEFAMAQSWKGGVLTLKLGDWKLASRIPSYIDRVRRLGFQNVKVAQLVHNRQEVALIYWK